MSSRYIRDSFSISLLSLDQGEYPYSRIVAHLCELFTVDFTKSTPKSMAKSTPIPRLISEAKSRKSLKIVENDKIWNYFSKIQKDPIRILNLSNHQMKLIGKPELAFKSHNTEAKEHLSLYLDLWAISGLLHVVMIQSCAMKIWIRSNIALEFQGNDNPHAFFTFFVASSTR